VGSATALAKFEEYGYNDNQLTIIKDQIAKGASDGELLYFLEVCRMTGLSPIQRQIYAVMRFQNEKQPDGKWKNVQRMTIQTGIDGYRTLAARTKDYAGSDDAIFGPEEAGHPKTATVTVWRFVRGQRCAFTATARWSEYVQEKDEYEDNQKTGRKVPAAMWAKMPYLMLAKCAEALALRKAFPAELSGIYTTEEMMQADSDPDERAYTPARREPEYKAERIVEADVDQTPNFAPPDATLDAEPVEEGEPQVTTPPGDAAFWKAPAIKDHQLELVAALREAHYTSVGDVTAYLNQLVKRDGWVNNDHVLELTKGEAKWMSRALHKLAMDDLAKRTNGAKSNGAKTAAR
jgi:phage recombination protein Bet